MSILFTGGLGYIPTNTITSFVDHDKSNLNNIIIMDNLSNSNLQAVQNLRLIYPEINIKTYLPYDARDYEKTKNSIGYVVQRFSMGYDFKNIDYIIFSDRKTAYKDIIQCIGRGTRSDKLGEDGKNLNKNLLFYMPCFSDIDSKTKKKITI